MKWIFNLKKYPVTITYCKAVGFACWARRMSGESTSKMRRKQDRRLRKLSFNSHYNSLHAEIEWFLPQLLKKHQYKLPSSHVLQVCFDIVGVGLHPGLSVLFANKKAAGYVCFPSLGHDNGSEKIIKRRNKTQKMKQKNGGTRSSQAIRSLRPFVHNASIFSSTIMTRNR